MPDIEENRLVDYLTGYLQSSEPATVTPSMPPDPSQMQAAASSTPTSKANKTIQSRRTTLGDKTVSKPALKKLQNG